MNLDKRIKDRSHIFDCFSIDEAKQYIGQKGYFTDFIENYQNLVNICYGTLIEIKDDGYAFKCEVAADYWRFFIPESFLKPKSKEQENEDLKKQVEDLKEKIKFWENRYKALEDHCLSVKRFFLKNK